MAELGPLSLGERLEGARRRAVLRGERLRRGRHPSLRLRAPQSGRAALGLLQHRSDRPDLVPGKTVKLPMQDLRWAFACLLVLTPLAVRAEAPAPLPGYSAEASRVERDWETRFRAIPSPEVLRETVKRLSARPHHLGSPADKENAGWILSKFKEWGLDAHIETFEVLFPTPRERRVELLEPTRFTARLREPPIPGDPTSNQQDQQLPTYNAYSADGDVTAPLAYVNYAIPEDYAQLEPFGSSVTGAIAI